VTRRTFWCQVVLSHDDAVGELWRDEVEEEKQWCKWFVVVPPSKNNLPLADHIDERLFRMSKNNSELWNFFCWIDFIFILHTFCVELVPFDKATSSGQDQVPKSNLITCVVWLSVFRSHAPTTQSSRQLKISYYTTHKIDHNFFTVSLHCQLPSLFSHYHIFSAIRPVQQRVISWNLTHDSVQLRAGILIYIKSIFPIMSKTYLYYKFFSHMHLCGAWSQSVVESILHECFRGPGDP